MRSLTFPVAACSRGNSPGNILVDLSVSVEGNLPHWCDPSIVLDRLGLPSLEQPAKGLVPRNAPQGYARDAIISCKIENADSVVGSMTLLLEE